MLRCLFILLLVTSVAHAAPQPRLVLSAGLSLGHTAIRHDEAPANGLGPGLNVKMAVHVHRLLALALDAWHLRPGFASCMADAACVNDRGEPQTILSAGPRLTLPEGVHLQATLGATQIERYSGEQTWEPTMVYEAGYALARGRWALELSLRASHRSDEDISATVRNVALVVATRRSW